MSEQLTLDFGVRDNVTFANFFTAENQQLLASLQQFCDGEGERFIYLYGVVGVGKSHLLQACCQAVASNKRIAYLPLTEFVNFAPEILNDLECVDLIAIDDVDAVMGDAKWEEALFHLYNRVRDNQTALIVSSTFPPSQLPCQLADLKSRLAWGLAWNLRGLSEQEMIQALQMRAELRGMTLPDDVAQYLLRHCPRDMPALMNVLEQLDKASLVAQRKITVPFVKQIVSS